MARNLSGAKGLKVLTGLTALAILAALPALATGSSTSGCTGLLDSRQVLSISIFMDPSEWKSLQAVPQDGSYHAAFLSCEGGERKTVGVRRAPDGALTSGKPDTRDRAQDAAQRVSLEIATDHTVKGQSIDGRKRLTLLAGTRVPGNAGGGKSRSFANLQVNGSHVGLYTLIPAPPEVSERAAGPTTPLARSEKIAGAAPGGPLILINEVLANTPGGNDVEFIELYNAGTAAQDLSGWYLLDSDDLHDRCMLAGTLEPGAFLVVPGITDLFTARYPGVTALNPNQCDSDQAGVGFGLGNGDDIVRLFRETASVPELVDMLTYGRQGVDISFGYRPFDADAAEYLSTPTPGATNDRSELHSSVCINEFLTTSLTGGIDDWVELYNRGNAAVDLSGWFLSDNVNDPLRYTFPAGTTISAGGFLTVDETLLGFSLSSSGSEVVLLTRADGTTGQDYFDFGPQFADVSQGRFPDGSPNWHFFVEPSRGDTNSCDNGPTPPAKVSGLVFSSPSTLQWSAGSGADAYDVLHGDLDGLRSVQGDFSSAVSGCAANNLEAQAAFVNDQPAQPGDGRFYLTRGIHYACGFGSYDTATASLAESRDLAILASPNTCP